MQRCNLPEISIIVPTYNESFVIESKLEALLNISYPQKKCEIIVVDSGSSDGTCDIVRRFEDRGVALIEQEKRLGKASALNLAMRESRGEILIISDANSAFESNSISKLVEEFHEGVGAVQPRICPHKDANAWDRVFHYVHHVFKNLESNADSVFFASGKLFAFRKRLIDGINENAAADDLEIAMSIRRRNYKIKYAPDIKVIEKTPATQAEARIQRVRRAFGVLQAIGRNISLLFNPRYASYGLIILPMHSVQMTLQPFLILYMLFFIIVRLAQVIGYSAGGPYFVGLCIFIALSSLLISKKVKRIFSIGFNFLATQLYIIIAIFDLIRGKDYRIWKKVLSTRDVLN
jgi:cellulose synthase/poly-beta-1,6-N-acetylglucosamine synthase-like glycosyltransferase